MNNYQCYQVLGLQEGASIKEVKSAYRSLVLKFHPDKNVANQDDTKFKIITEAYQVLRSEYKKSIGTPSGKYDKKDSDKNQGFSNSWGAKKSDRSQEDWTRYTQYAENEYQTFWSHYEKTFWEYYEKVRGEKNDTSDPIPTKEEILVSVNVDPGRCIACCSCETIAPTVFKVEKNVKVNPKSKVINESGASSEKILDAAQTCPTKAISVTDKESCRRLYPW